MTTFEFVFSMFGLVLGLSVTEILTGFARVLQSHGKMRLGWLTPLLGVILLLDLVTFWTKAWALRESLEPSFIVLAFGLAIAGVYYLAAALVFPDADERWPDPDTHFMQTKALVMGGVIAANWLMTGGQVLLFGNVFGTLRETITPFVFTAVGVALMLVRSKRICLAIEIAVLAIYLVRQLV